mgnify:CR=1 FL=1
MNRARVETRQILLRAPQQVELAIRLIQNLPLDYEEPIEIIIREQKKKRSLDLNAAYWAGPLADLERDGWVHGIQLSAEQWHFRAKQLFLPDENAPDFDSSEVLKGYQKWIFDPWQDSRILIGSTTKLSQKGMRKFVLQVEAWGASEFGIEFLDHSGGGRSLVKKE